MMLVFSLALALASVITCGGGESDRFIQVAAGGAHSCALSSSGSVSCWGSDEFGQLRAPADERFTSITAGNIHSCGLRSDGTAVCWGSDIFAPFEDNSEETERRLVPVFPPKDERFTSISAGGAVTCGLREDGDAVCWEVTPDGRGKYSPFEMEKVIEIATGAADLGVCGLREDGSIICWRPVEITVPPAEERFDAISIGFSYGCGLYSDGSVLCWGIDSAGQFPPVGAGPFSAIASGTFHTCGLRTNGSVECWGYDWERYAEFTFGPNGPPESILGDKTPEYFALYMSGSQWMLTEPRTEPPEGERFTSIAAGSWHTCGLRRTVAFLAGATTTMARLRLPATRWIQNSRGPPPIQRSYTRSLHNGSGRLRRQDLARGNVQIGREQP